MSLNNIKCPQCNKVWKIPNSSKTLICSCGAMLDIADKEAPNIIRKMVNLTGAIKEHIITGAKHCTEEEKQERYNICQSNQCGLFRKYGDGGICAHNDCGCFIRNNGHFLDKLSWAESKCPEGFWGPIVEKDEETPENGV